MTKDEGGRYTPFMQHYRPQLYLRTADVSVGLLFPEGTADADEKMVSCGIPPSSMAAYTPRAQVMPGDNVELVCDLVHDVAAEVGTR